MDKIRDARVVAKGIISKSLYENLNKTLFDAVTKLDVRWRSAEHRTSFIEVVEEFMDDVVADGKIRNYKVICDGRNNRSFTKQDEILFSVKYKQPHCLEWTTIDYYVKNENKR
jgi:hypothetical protein